MNGVTRVSRGTAAAICSSPPTVASVVPAPIRTEPSSRAMPLSSSNRDTSIRWSKNASRSESIGTRLWPPGQNLGVVAELGQHPRGVVDAFGAVVFERRGLHERWPRLATRRHHGTEQVDRVRGRSEPEPMATAALVSRSGCQVVGELADEFGRHVGEDTATELRRLPETVRSVVSTHEVLSPSSFGFAVTSAAALPCPRVSLAPALMTARRADRPSRGTPLCPRTSSCGLFDQVDDRCGTGGQPGECHAERRQRVVDRVDDGRRRADRTALADALVTADARARESRRGRTRWPGPRWPSAAGSRRTSMPAGCRRRRRRGSPAARRRCPARCRRRSGPRPRWG